MSYTRKVLLSPGYGAGWSTWNNDDLRQDFLFDAVLISTIEAGASLATPLGDFVARMDAKHGKKYRCFLGAYDLTVVEVVGKFIVEEYDGFESIRSYTETDWV